jgi:hypothetical protein
MKKMVNRMLAAPQLNAGHVLTYPLQNYTCNKESQQNHPSVETTFKIYSTHHHAEDEILMAELTL